MKKLHKKLEKVAEHIDLSHVNQVRLLKELSIACQHYELAASMRGFERIAEQELAEESAFIKPASELSPLEQELTKAGYQVLHNVPEDLIPSEEEAGLSEEEMNEIDAFFMEEKAKSLLDTLETNTESLNTRVDNLIDKLNSQSNSTLSTADVAQIGEWLSTGGKGISIMTILGDDSDIEKTIDRGLAITSEVLKQGMELKEAQEKEEPELLVNSIKTPDGTILTSHHRHDYVCHEDAVTGTRYCLDGGDFYRRILPGGIYQDLSVYSDDPFEKIRESLSRLGRGKNFDQPAKWYALKDMNDNWLAELIPWIEDNQPNNKYKKYYLQEIEYRKENGITVKEEEEC